MKITDTARYLALARHALQTAVMPELQSAAARDAAGMIAMCLDEALHRQAGNATALRESLQAGAAIAARMTALARAHGVNVGMADEDAGIDMVAAVDNFERYAAAHAALTARLAALAHALAASPNAQAHALMREAAQWEAAANAALLPPKAPASQAAEAIEATAADGLPRAVLETFIRRVHPDGERVCITRFDPIPGGFSKHTYNLALREADGRERALIVRKNNAHPTLLHASCRIDREFHFVRAVAATGYRAPTPLWLGSNVTGTDADFYVMEHLPGKVPSAFLGGAKVPEDVALDMARCLAQLHALGPRDMPDDVMAYEDAALRAPGDTVEACYRRIIASWCAYAREIAHPPSPTLEYLLDWLARNIPRSSAAPVLVHGDFNVHNVLAEGGRITAVLDWEVVGFGAPEQDLGYIKPIISQHIDWDRFYAYYLECGGRPCDLSTLPFYQSFAALRVLLAGMRVTQDLQNGSNPQLRNIIFELGLNPQFMNIALDNTN